MLYYVFLHFICHSVGYALMQIRQWKTNKTILSELWQCCLGRRKGMQPVKISPAIT